MENLEWNPPLLTEVMLALDEAGSKSVVQSVELHAPGDVCATFVGTS